MPWRPNQEFLEGSKLKQASPWVGQREDVWGSRLVSVSPIWTQLAGILLTGRSESLRVLWSGHRQPPHFPVHRAGAGHRSVLFCSFGAGRAEAREGLWDPSQLPWALLQLLTLSSPVHSGDWPGGGREPLLHAGFGGGAGERHRPAFSALVSCRGAGQAAEPQHLA